MDAGMKNWKVLCFASALVFSLSLPVCAAEQQHDAICHEGGWLLPAPATDKPGRKYMRDRVAHVDHLKLDVTPDFAARSIRATSTLAFKPIAKPLAKLELDSVGLTIDGVTAQGATLKEHEVTE